MSNEPSLPKRGRYVVTELGHQVLEVLETCACEPRLSGGLFQCEVCGTIWAKVAMVRSFWSGARVLGSRR